MCLEHARRSECGNVGSSRAAAHKNLGRITAKLAKDHAESEFEKFRPRQDLEYRSDFDKEVKKLQSDKKIDS